MKQNIVPLDTVASAALVVVLWPNQKAPRPSLERWTSKVTCETIGDVDEDATLGVLKELNLTNNTRTVGTFCIANKN